jgi:hypothetical protein
MSKMFGDLMSGLESAERYVKGERKGFRVHYAQEDEALRADRKTEADFSAAQRNDRDIDAE